MYVPETRCGFRAKNFLEARVRNIFRITSRNHRGVITRCSWRDPLASAGITRHEYELVKFSGPVIYNIFAAPNRRLHSALSLRKRIVFCPISAS